MAIQPISPGFEPLGHFDVLDTDLYQVRGGEVMVFDHVEPSVLDKSAPDVYINEDGYKAILRLATGLDYGPFYFVDPMDRKYQSPGYEISNMFTQNQSFAQTFESSGKAAIYFQEGFYAINSEAVDTDTINSQTPVHTRLYVDASGKITATPSSSAALVGFFLEYRDGDRLRSQRSKMMSMPGTFKTGDTIIVFKTNADGYLNLDIGAIAEAIGSTSTLGTPTDGYFSDGLFAFSSSTTIADAVDSLNEHLNSFRDAVSDAILYVDPVSGSDALGDGSLSSPFATVQKAVYALIPPYSPAPYWARGEDKEVRILYSVGMSPIDEFVHIPIHLGPAALNIVGEEEILYTLTQTGAPAVSDGYKSLYTVNFTSSPMTTGELNKGAFITPVNKSSIATHRNMDDLAIFDNDTGSLRVVSHTIYFGFAGFKGQSYKTNEQFNIVRPQIVWQVSSNDGYKNPSDAIFNVDGGNVNIEGIRFEGYSGNYGSNSSQVFSYSGNGYKIPNTAGFIMPSSGLARCIVYDSPAAFLNGNGLYANGLISSIGEDVNFEMCAKGSSNIELNSVIFEARTGYPRLSISGGNNVNINGYFSELTSVTAHPGGLTYENNSHGSLTNVDMNRSFLSSSYNSYLSITDCKIHQSTTSSPSFISYLNSSITMLRCENSGTDGYGVSITKGSKAFADLATVTGTNGEVLVGATVGSAATKPIVDASSDFSAYIDYSDFY